MTKPTKLTTKKTDTQAGRRQTRAAAPLSDYLSDDVEDALEEIAEDQQEQSTSERTQIDCGGRYTASDVLSIGLDLWRTQLTVGWAIMSLPLAIMSSATRCTHHASGRTANVDRSEKPLNAFA